ncbi:hypothetical protein KFE25_001774 [Diacronema lutheri]|uniref:Radical SAM core domain-containing protein n=1 Tax=Diacronema lutheri TaxID=2081491 RepID=A0A8J5X7N2_DIALT|nr:hypothetical protein KFE25_001774 [Diacronema lutheri]
MACRPAWQPAWRPLAFCARRRAHSTLPARREQAEALPPRLALPADEVLTDRHGRRHTYLRLSLTERCSLRCGYCMPADGVKLTAAERLLKPAEMLRIAEAFVLAGVTKIRLTGGEPTVRADLEEVVGSLSSLRPLGLEHVALTSNGVALRRRLPALRTAGLDSINLSLDTLDRRRFEQICRRDALPKVLETIDAAIDHGYADNGHLKLNCVVLGGVNEDELPAFARFAAERPLDVRFIEYMPFGGNNWSEAKLVPAAEMRARLLASGIALTPVDTHAHDTARSYALDGGRGRVSFISSMTEHFCSGCNRVRVTADGNLKVCLFGQRELSLRDALREGASTVELHALIHAALGRKHARHAGMHEIARQAVRPMTTIGG